MYALKPMLKTGVFELDEDVARVVYPQYFPRKGRGKGEGGMSAASKEGSATAKVTAASKSSGDEKNDLSKDGTTEPVRAVEDVPESSTATSTHASETSTEATSASTSVSSDTAKTTTAVPAKSSKELLKDAVALATQALKGSREATVPASTGKPDVSSGNKCSLVSSVNNKFAQLNVGMYPCYAATPSNQLPDKLLTTLRT